MWKRSKTCGVKFEVFHDGFGDRDILGEWTAFDVNMGSFFWHISILVHYLFREQTIPTVTGGAS